MGEDGKQERRDRTADVQTETLVEFNDLHLPVPILEGLRDCGYVNPSPIQLKAIPPGRFGRDLLLQAKSGTGKTLVFTVIALETVKCTIPLPQVLVLTPTREVAFQVRDSIERVGRNLSGLRCATFVGGFPVAQDKETLRAGCHIVTGTPGRLSVLIEQGVLRTRLIRLLVLDEVDKLFQEAFRRENEKILKALPEDKQVLAVSATLSEAVIDKATRLMRNPQHIRLTRSLEDTPLHPATVTAFHQTSASLAEKQPKAPGVSSSDTSHPLWLKGIKQLYHVVDPTMAANQGTASAAPPASDEYRSKVAALLLIFRRFTFHQCVLFCNHQGRASALAETLSSFGWPATFISGALSQEERVAAMHAMRQFDAKILVSTDLTARGVDLTRVNLVVNLDLPRDPATYLHRVGRAGRFGGTGIAMSIVYRHEEPTIKLLARVLELDIEEFKTEDASTVCNRGQREAQREGLVEITTNLPAQDSVLPCAIPRSPMEGVDAVLDKANISSSAKGMVAPHDSVSLRAQEPQVRRFYHAGTDAVEAEPSEGSDEARLELSEESGRKYSQGRHDSKTLDSVTEEYPSAYNYEEGVYRCWIGELT